MALIITTQNKYNTPNPRFESIIRTYNSWAVLGRNVFIINDPNTNAALLRNQLMNACGEFDRIFVASLDGEAAWAGYDSAISNWFRSNLPIRHVSVPEAQVTPAHPTENT